MNRLNEIRRKKGKKKIIMLTAYDYQMAKILDEVGIDLILVGDSLGMVVLGYPDTRSVTIQEMLHHTRIVAKGSENTPIIGDMPINSYNTVEEALTNAKQFLEVGAHGVKIEGNKTEVIKALVDNGIPVMGHIGLLPQTAQSYRLRGRDADEAQRIFDDATKIDKLNVFSIVLECIPELLSKRITDAVKAPTIGIGAGRYCDGQVLVINDMLGLDKNAGPKYVKRYANLNETITKAITKFKEEVLNGDYPDREHTYHG